MNTQINYSYFIPGFGMGISRAVVSHPFEVLKLNSQMGMKFSLKGVFKGLHYSVFSSGFERGIQFLFFDNLKKNYSTTISSAISSGVCTCITMPFNVLLLKRLYTNTITPKKYFYGSSLEFTRSYSGSFIFLNSFTIAREHTSLPIASIISTNCVWAFTYPIDTIKNRYLSNKPIILNQLYRGISFPIMRSIPSSIIGMWVYENLKSLIS